MSASTENSEEQMERHWRDVRLCVSLANHLRGGEEQTKEFHSHLSSVTNATLKGAQACRKRWRERQSEVDTSDETITSLARFTDNLPLEAYTGLLDVVPRLVNVVSLAEAMPREGSGTTLPLDLRLIAARCTNAYWAPRRFAAVQLAFSTPRCRVLVFHTGRLVGTGCAGPMAARLAISKTIRQLVRQVGIHVRVAKLTVINQVGAMALGATLDCDAFANTHSSSAHYDRASFVGLAWRPPNSSCCVEIYSCATPRL